MYTTYSIAHVLLAASYLVSPAHAIVGGQAIQIANAPFMASVRFAGNYVCGGTVISRNTILTAAACVRGRPAADLTIRVGSDLKNSGGQVIQVATKLVHPSYDATLPTVKNVALLKIAGTFDQAIVSVPPSSRGTAPPAGANVGLYGFGQTDAAGTSSSVLRSVVVQVVSRPACDDAYGIGYISSDQFCDGVPQGAKGTCKGDEGGPVIANGQVVGIISDTTFCSKQNFPNIETALVDSNLNFIKANI